ncbi:MAG: hypothetical protein H6557_07665 [Lewinellaceae bacterium]|nr:hypothetical protein [Phaeodactylibacter sp.]MCB9036478.1 hypothetical protein [Lewinellaceae bacterium]
MQTGEGKTLAAVFPAYLNALSGKRATCLTLATRAVVRCLLFVDRCCNLLAAKRMAAQRNRQPTTGNRQLANLRRVARISTTSSATGR